MSTGLPASRLINVAVNLTPALATFPNLSSAMIFGDSDVINVVERFRTYSTIEEVAADFGTNAPEYEAALLWFGQAPQPTSLHIARWASGGSKGLRYGRALTTGEQALANFTAITTGSFKVELDNHAGTYTSVTGLDFSAATTLQGVAAIIDGALAGATVTWDSDLAKFVIESDTTGATSEIGAPAAAATGTDIRTVMGWNAGTTGIAGIASETAVAALAILDGLPVGFYGVAFAASSMPNTAAMLAVADYVEAASSPHLLAATTQDANALLTSSTTDLAAEIEAAGYNRTFCQYSSDSAYAAVSAMARLLTTDYSANSSVITLMYKQEPLITPETLTTSQANALQAKNCNVFVNYDNATAIIQYGTVGSGLYLDEVAGVDALRLSIQTDLYNALYGSATKIPQTDAGNAILANVINATCARFAANGLLGPGTWTAGGFGQLKTGDLLSQGFYVYQPPVANQSTADRQARKSVSFQVAAKLAGAIHTVDATINVNR